MPAKFPVRLLAFLLRTSLLTILIMGETPENHSPPAVLAHSPDDSAVSQRLLSAAPAAAFSGTPTRGLPSLDVQFTDESSGAPTGWAWYFGDEPFDNPWTSTPLSEWTPRLEHSSVTLPDGSIVLMGGATYRNDVWRSTDGGTTWTEMTASAAWAGREAHTSVVLPDGSIVLMGGSTGTGTHLNDVWRSTDKGATWTQQTAAAEWGKRSGASAVVLTDGSIVLIGGLGYNDVWRSENQGETWTRLTAAAAWSARWLHTCVVLSDDSIVLMGGWDVYDVRNDVWRSTDQGATWVQMTASAGWAARRAHTSVAASTTIWLMGGTIYGSAFNDVWRSDDLGATWTPVTASAGWTPRGYHSTVILPDATIVLTGGGFGSEVWHSTDAGATWTQISWPTARSGHGSATLPDGSLVITGGYDSARRNNEVWRSVNQGATWTRKPLDVGWAAREGHSLVALPDGSLVLMGGDDGSDPRRDVWRSTDQGETWVQQAANAPWAARSGHTALLLPDGAIILIGGLGATGSPKNDVWRSTDQGATWVQLTAAAEWSGRTHHASVVLSDGSIVLLGGLSADSPTHRNDVWRSVDGGATWVQQTAAAPWGRRFMLAAVALPDDSVILMGGDYLGTPYNDVWRSADQGATWVQLTAGAEWTARAGHTAAVLPDGRVMLVGGYDGTTRLRDVWRWETAGSIQQHPAHTYTAPGTYSVALQVANFEGYSSLRRDAYIRVSATEEVLVYLPLVLRSTP